MTEKEKEKYNSLIDKLTDQINKGNGGWTIFNPEKMGIPSNPKTDLFLQEYIGWNYANVSVIADTMSEIKFKLYRYNSEKDIVEEIKEHPILELIYQVNPNMTKGDFVFIVTANLLLTGEAPIRLRRKNPNNPKEIPYELHPVNPADLRVFVGYTPDNYELIAKYTLKDKSDPNDITKVTTLNPWEILFIKTPNPYNPHRGAGVVEASAITLDTIKYSENYNINFFKNSGVPYAILSSDQPLKKETLERLKEQWDKNYRGFDNAYKTAILEQGLKMEKLQIAQKDMDFLEQQKFLRDKLMAMYKTNPVILGVIENANRASAESSEYVFMKHCIRPKMKRLVEYFNEFLIPIFDPTGKQGMFLDFVDPVKEDRTQEIHQFSVACDKWMTKNEIRARENLPDIEGGDEIYQPVSLQPLGTEPIQPSQPKPVGPNSNTPAEPNINPDGTIGQPNESNGGKMIGWKVFKVSKETKEKFASEKFADQIAKMRNRNIRMKQWQKEFMEQIQKLVRIKVMKKYNGVKKYKDIKLPETKEKFSQILLDNSKVFEQKLIKLVINEIYEPQQREIINNINSKGLRFITRKNADDLLFGKQWEKKIFNLLNPFFRTIITKQGQEGMELIGGFSYNLSDEASNHINKTTSLSAKSIIETISQKVKDALGNGISKKESKIDLIARMVGTYRKLEKTQPNQIAETEVARVTNYALLDAYRQSGIVNGKQWLINPEGKTCPFCNQAAIDFQEKALNDTLIKKNETYTGSDGKTMVADYEDILGPPLHVNCGCVIGPILEEIKTVDEIQEKVIPNEPEKSKESEESKEPKEESDNRAEELLDKLDKEITKGMFDKDKLLDEIEETIEKEE